ncbi:VRR-NUC domain-containing protein [Celerinatantimonas yamalensis]|uniref:phosphodiesterase I n=1 Tax=Celerinatantimonas yamalensis TaxID=559956 RepID=A0ABW9GAN6_9GAMM
MTIQQTIELPSDYYLTNFWQLLNGVQQRYNDLLSVNELTRIQTLKRLSVDGQKLYVRLACRKGAYFRQDKLRYAEINSIEHALAELQTYDLICSKRQCDWSIIGQLCTLNELRQFAKQLPQPIHSNGLKKAALLKALTHTPPPTLPFKAIKLLDDGWMALFELLYFNSSRQSLTDFVLSDLRLIRYEQYRLDQQTRLYQTREQIEQALQLAQMADEIVELDKGGDWPIDAYVNALPSFPAHPAIARRGQRITETLAREYERRGKLDTALSLYQRGTSAFSRERQARILGKTAPQQALELLQTMLHHPINLSEQQFAQEFTYRLGRQLNMPLSPPPTCDYPRIDWPAPPRKGAPEQCAIELLEQQGWQGVHCENALINGILALTLWPALFDDGLPGVFFHPFQSGPVDLYNADFYQKRQTLIDRLLAEITTPSWPHTIQTRYRTKYGLANPLFDWQALPETLLQSALERVPATIWQALARYQLFDLRQTRAGMPDLFVWKGNQYGWIEVKGPNDKLQTNQLLWIAQLQRLKQPVAVCYLGHQPDAQISPLHFCPPEDEFD